MRQSSGAAIRSNVYRVIGTMARSLARIIAIAGCASLYGCGSTPAHVDFVETVGSVSFVMKAIPRGELEMGCGLDDEPCGDSEWVNRKDGVRQRPIDVNAFFIAETETTWNLYQR